nr:biotin--[acetyl-CoA-carboxylase] ligase [Petrachloros mirabilis]
MPDCASTNSWILAHGRHLPSGDAVFTRHQTAGRGQQGRLWQAPPGVLTVSFGLDWPVSEHRGVTLGVGLAVIYAIADLMPALDDALQIKWPNDIWVQQRKLAGILCEMGQREGWPSLEMQRVIVGIGLNRQVNFTPEALAALDYPISLHQLGVPVPSELALLTRLRDYLRQLASFWVYAETQGQSGLAALLPDLNRRDALRQQLIQVTLGNKQGMGTALGLDAQGRLLVRGHNQSCYALATGSVRCLTRKIAKLPSKYPEPVLEPQAP